ncbi:hypothetical protein LADH09A_000867 [Micromonospora sp. LAH09]|uniref:hypothetical protein n=1 Tax=Micromonospora cabrerizensis TaxID=2911213 RepID=UPI001EE8B93D|nr:hypothetical protein [Micromonospora cabrerizensis]MCG5472984.1 hypothetical protein [Micromonospora cabrerizensis]
MQSDKGMQDAVKALTRNGMVDKGAPSMSVSDLDKWRAAVVLEMSGGRPPGVAADALLALTLNEPNVELAAGIIAGVVSTAADPNLKRLGVICCGHLARTHGIVPVFLVELLNSLSDSGVLVGEVEDALGDIRFFALSDERSE